MKIMQKLSTILPAIALAALLSACASGSPSRESGGVEDIQPGDKSVIQAPAPARAQQKGIEERAL